MFLAVGTPASVTLSLAKDAPYRQPKILLRAVGAPSLQTMPMPFHLLQKMIRVVSWGFGLQTEIMLFAQKQFSHERASDN